MSGVVPIGPLTYQGKPGCESPLCTRSYVREVDGTFQFGPCVGWHCSYCDEPCSFMGHGCDASKAILDESERILREQGRIK